MREGDIGMQLGEIAKANPGVAIGSYPFFDPQSGPNTNVVLRARDPQKLAQAKRAVEDMLERVRRAQSSSWSSPSHGENRGSSPLGSANDFSELRQFRPPAQFPHLQLFSNGQCFHTVPIERNLRRDIYLNPGNPQDARVSSLQSAHHGVGNASPGGREADARRTNVTSPNLRSRCASSFNHLVGA